MDEAMPYHVEMAVWCEPDSGTIVGHELARPGDRLAALGRAYHRATKAPLVGQPRVPKRVRVATPELATAMQATVASGTVVVVAATPEVDDIAATLTAQMRADLAGHRSGSGGPERSDFTTGGYLHGGLVSAEIVADLFRAAHLLSAIAPWKVAADSHLVRADIPSLGIRGAAISILGNAGLNDGFLILSDDEAFETMCERIESGAAKRDGGLGTPVLSLRLDRIEDLPEGAATEVEAHGWKDANGRYPWVESREADGSLMPVDAQKMKLVIAVAETIGTFCMKASDAFRTDGEESASMTIETRGRTVRYTMPYESFDEFEATPSGKQARRKGRREARTDAFEASLALERVGSQAPRPAQRQPKVGRNAACPCGSGRKYKHCHLSSDEADTAAEQASVPDSPWTEALEYVFAYASTTLGAGFRRWPDDFQDMKRAGQLLMEWSLFHVQVKGQTAAEAFLADPSLDVPRSIRRFLEAQQAAWLSVWEVQSVEPGREFTARDLLTGEFRRVSDRKASQCLTVRESFLGRIAEWEGRSTLWGVYGQGLPPLAAQHVIDAMRKRLRIGRAGLAPIDALRSHRTGRFLIACWEDAVAQMEHERRHPPRMTTTDGEDLVVCTVTFEFDARRRTEILAGLDRMSGALPPSADERARGELTYTFAPSQEGPRMKGASLREHAVGAVHVRDTELVLETNSRERRGALLPRLLEAVGVWVREKDRTEVDVRQEYLQQLAQVEAGAELGRPKPTPVPPPEVLEKVLELKREHNWRWLDESIPALGGKTPRQAARLVRSRDELDLLLRDMEHREANAPEWERTDVEALRRELGL